jgi:hypothetical protein
MSPESRWGGKPVSRAFSGGSVGAGAQASPTRTQSWPLWDRFGAGMATPIRHPWVRPGGAILRGLHASQAQLDLHNDFTQGSWEVILCTCTAGGFSNM